MASLPVVTEQTFEQEVVRSELPVLIDFTADWCQPCKQVAPEVEALATELQGKAKVVQIDIDKSPRLAQMLRIQSVPTFLVVFQGRPVAADRGVLPRKRLRQLIEPFLPRAAGAIRAAELAQLVKEGQVVAVDTRDAGSYARAHIPGAAHMPLEEIQGRLAELHMLGAPVLYCRAGDKSKALCETLEKEGIEVAFLEGGMLGWEADSLPIERED